MVRKYKRKSNRAKWKLNKWSTKSIEKALSLVLDSGVGLQSASKKCGVPKSTLFRKVKAARKIYPNNIEVEVKVPLGPKKPVFSKQEEDELSEYLKLME